tara:strand:+ start:98 stop:217 length:120 start_codon:yes stop_codon:yes gene_type:complete
MHLKKVLDQSLAKDFGPKEIHVAYLIIDAFINHIGLGLE